MFPSILDLLVDMIMIQIICKHDTPIEWSRIFPIMSIFPGHPKTIATLAYWGNDWIYGGYLSLDSLDGLTSTNISHMGMG